MVVPTQARRLLAVLVALAVLPLVGCPRGNKDGAADVKIDLSICPDPPKVGEAKVVLQLTDEDGKPIRGATLELEGNMNHAGMKPVFAEPKEAKPGRYEAVVEFTMGGDWFVLITGTLADGRKLKRKIDVPGVKSK